MKVCFLPILALIVGTYPSAGPALAGSIGQELLDQSNGLKTTKVKPKAPKEDKAKTDVPIESYLFIDQDELFFNIGPSPEFDLKPASGGDEKVPPPAGSKPKYKSVE